MTHRDINIKMAQMMKDQSGTEDAGEKTKGGDKEDVGRATSDMVKNASNTDNATAYLDVQYVGCKNAAADPFCSDKQPANTSMKYKAVLDIDGNSWSSRFPRLLCYNSAVIKITLEEDYEEYFMADLEPNVHFIPATLENFTKVAAEYMKDTKENDAFLRQIVQNANAFCRERFTEDRLNLDFLSIMNSYVKSLDQYTNKNLCAKNETSNNNSGKKNDTGLSCWMKIWLDAKESYVGPAVQNQHNGFTDLCNRLDIPYLAPIGAAGTNNTLWDLKTYKVPAYDSVCSR